MLLCQGAGVAVAGLYPLLFPSNGYRGQLRCNTTAEPAHLWFASMWHKASTCNSPCSARHCSNCPAGKAWIRARRQPPKAAHNIASSRASRWRTSPLWETDGCCAGEHSWALDCLHQAARCLVVCGLCQGSCSPTQPLSVSDPTAYHHATVVEE